ncbi:MAG: succinate dehydrogenase, hydrophobic membrane anchor protein [Thiotrichales bacterium]|nr:succinate dehydrogenase, hydrophobic membrane anchor protein [Thiotrichales bacterium]
MNLQTLSGKKAHIWQRLSALYLLIYSPYLAWLSLSTPSQESLPNLAAHLLSPIYLLPTLVAILLLIVHSWIGLRDIIIDYTPRAHTIMWLWALRWLLILVSLNIVWVLLSLYFAR